MQRKLLSHIISPHFWLFACPINESLFSSLVRPTVLAACIIFSDVLYHLCRYSYDEQTGAYKEIPDEQSVTHKEIPDEQNVAHEEILGDGVTE